LARELLTTFLLTLTGITGITGITGSGWL